METSALSSATAKADDGAVVELPPRAPSRPALVSGDVITTTRTDDALDSFLASGRNTSLQDDVETSAAGQVPDTISEAFTVAASGARHTFSASVESPTGLTLAIVRDNDSEEPDIVLSNRWFAAGGSDVVVRDLSLQPGDYNVLVSTDADVEVETRIDVSLAPDAYVSANGTKADPEAVPDDVIGQRQRNEVFLRPAALKEDGFRNAVLTFPAGTANLRLYGLDGKLAGSVTGTSPLRMTGLAGKDLTLGIVAQETKESDSLDWRLTLEANSDLGLAAEGAELLAMKTVQLGPERAEATGWLNQRDSDVWTVPSLEGDARSYFIDYDGPSATISAEAESGKYSVFQKRATLGPFTTAQNLNLTVSSGSTGPYSLVRREEDATPNQLFEPDGQSAAQVFTTDQRVKGNLYGSDDRDRVTFDLGADTQMWRIMVVGEDPSTVTSVTLKTPLGTLFDKRANGRERRKRFRLPDAYIPGGLVGIDVSGRGGDYTVFLKPLGMPPASSEREPNFPVPTRIDMGQTYRGILNDSADGFSFFLEKPATLLLDLQVPPGARYSGSLSTFGQVRPDDYKLMRFEAGINEQTLELSAGEHQLTFKPTVASPAEYEFVLDHRLPFEPMPAFTVEAPMSFRAFSRFAQNIPLSLNWSGNVPSDVSYTLWSPHPEFTLEQTETLRLDITPDVKSGPRKAWLVATSGGKTVGAVEMVFESGPGAPLRNPRYIEEIPLSMRGGLNVALSALGGRWVEQPGYVFEEDGKLPRQNKANALGLEDLNDGISPSEETRGAGEYFANLSRGSEEIYMPTLDLAGDDPVPLAGFILTDRVRGPNAFAEFSIEASLDGRNWTTVLSDTLSEWGKRSVFPLTDGPVEARYVRLVPDWSGKSNYMLSEFEVIAVPGKSGLQSIDLAQPSFGAMTRGTAGWFYARDFVYGLGAGDARPTYVGVEGKPWSETGLVMTFKNQATADIERLRFHFGRPNESDTLRPSPRYARVMGSVSGPAGPFTERAIIELPEDFGPGSVFEAELPERERMNAIQVEYAAADKTEKHVSVPVRYDVIERAESEDYVSVLALGPEFGARPLSDTSGSGPDPILHSGDGMPIDTQEQSYRGFVEFDVSENRWFVPQKDGANTVVLTTTGERGFYPAVKASLPGGPDLNPLDVIDDPASMRRDYVFSIGEVGLDVTVSEPARSTIFLVDQSPSMSSFIAQIRRSVIDYADIMVAGQDRIMFKALGAEWLLDEWVDDPMILRRLLLDYQTSGNSSAETGLFSAAERLEDVDGLRSIVIVSDADAGPKAGLEKALRESQARIYTIKVSSARMWSNPYESIPLATQWSEMTGGEMNYIRLGSDITTAYERISTRLLGEKSYDVSATWETRVINPGTLVTQLARDASGEAGVGGDDATAIHVLFDASGSMLKRTQQGRRIEIAKRSITAFMDDAALEGSRIGLRTFGGAPDTCETGLLLDVEGGSPETFLDALDEVNPQNNAKTPIAEALSRLSGDLSSVSGNVRVLLITDGEETCNGNAEAVIGGLIEQGLADRVDIVSFALASGIDRAPYRKWAEAGKGVYIDAEDGDQLTEGLLATQERRFEVWKDGTEISSGVVGQTVLTLDPGIYQLRSDGFRADFEIKTDEATTVVLTK
ncbi:MAG: VWA domain-containing protein [Litorimonas sp.]